RLALVNTFEDTFGDIYGGGVWSELSETASSNISQNVVSLLLHSMIWEKRISACTGSFIEWNGCATILTSASLVSHFVGDKKIAENLRIEVLLPNKERRGGALQHYNLHYNVALVNVKDFSAPHPVNIQPQRSNYSSELVAIGCCFKSGMLMAARGQHTEMLGSFDCKLLKCSTCKITKAGIGGPLVDSDGKFIGMNFCGPDLTVAEVGLDAYASGVLDWAIDGDNSSVRPNRYSELVIYQ
uniref:Peptidase S1 domain-containing protein n=1 Tax=Setaria italica TaxID=4555 RepID=K3XPX5_SETIT